MMEELISRIKSDIGNKLNLYPSFDEAFKAILTEHFQYFQREVLEAERNFQVKFAAAMVELKVKDERARIIGILQSHIKPNAKSFNGFIEKLIEKIKG